MQRKRISLHYNEKQMGFKILSVTVYIKYNFVLASQTNIFTTLSSLIWLQVELAVKTTSFL